jgi:CSLREA domain-containing protein
MSTARRIVRRRVLHRHQALGFALLGTLVLAGSSPANAGGLVVTTTTDELDGSCGDGDCSLRDALAIVGNDQTIQFQLPGSPPWTIFVDSGQGSLVVPENRQNLSIIGPGASDLVLSGGDAVRVLIASTGTSTSISDLTFRDGRATSIGDRHGGCLEIEGVAELNLDSVRFESCQAWSGGLGEAQPGGDGGALYVPSGGFVVGDLLVFAGNAAGLGSTSFDFPGGEKGGRGGSIANEGILRLTNSTFSSSAAGNGGGPTGPAGEGGAIANLAGGSLRVDSSTFAANRSGDGATFGGVHGPDGAGGAIWCVGDCTFNNVTISGNTIGVSGAGTANGGGGIAVAGGTTRLRNVTTAGNTANGTGGGIAVSAGTIRPRNSLLANNAGAASQHDCSITGTGSIVSEGHNLIRVNDDCAAEFSGTDQEGTSGAPLEPLLGALANNGGPTETRSIATGSPAIDAGEPITCKLWEGFDNPMPFDQRGFDRHVDGDGDLQETCDVGAYEAPMPPPEEHTLTVALAGAPNGGSVTSDPAGIDCGVDCTETYVETTTVELTPVPIGNHLFTGWSGDCSGTGACSFDMSVDRNVTATFEAYFGLTVTLGGEGSGTVESDLPGIDCQPNCFAIFLDGDVVTLTAAPDAASTFFGWSGDCDADPCVLQMTEERAVTATFQPFRELTVELAGSGGGAVTSEPAGIDCGSSCSAEFEHGTLVALTPEADDESTFAGWSGDCEGELCDLVMDANRTVIATFVLSQIFVDGFENGDVCVWSSAIGAPPCPP